MRLRLLTGAVVVLVALVPSLAGAATGPAPTQAWVRTSAAPTFVPAAGRLYVAADLGAESARAFIAGSGEGTVVVLTEDPASSAGAGGVRACPLTTPLVADGELNASTAPAADCTRNTDLERRDDGTWRLALDDLGPVDHGVALVAVPAGPAPFRVGFDPTKTELVPAPTATSTVPPPAAEAAAVAASAPPSSSNGVGSVDSGTAIVTGPVDAAVPDAPADVVAPTGPAPVLDVVAEEPVDEVAMAAASEIIGAASPAAPLVLGIVGAVTALVAVAASRRSTDPRRPASSVRKSGKGAPVAFAASLALAPVVLSETATYKLGLVLVLFVGAIGLHLLVNWAGELSLAHATLVGLPAFVVAKVSADHGLSPILLLPLGVGVGLLAGAVVGLPAIRARGLQVALVTLAAGIAIDRFFFTRAWVVGGDGGAPVPVPSLGPLTLATSRSLFPVLLVATVGAVAAAWAIHRSKLGRALLWLKSSPDGAAAFGIPVARYRTGAYALAGGFAGLSGGLTAMWVQRLTPDAFPLSRSFTFLIVVALAGRGFVGGVALAAAMIEGGRLFLPGANAVVAYAGPVGLMVTLTQHRAGLNGLGRQLAARLRSSVLVKGTTTVNTSPSGVRPLLVAGSVLCAVGLGAIALAWYHAGNTSQVWIQNQELLSGGAGGLALVLIGVGLVISDGLASARAADAANWDRLLRAVEARDSLTTTELASVPSPSPSRRSRARARSSA